MAEFKEALSNLSPIAFDDLPSKDGLPPFLTSLFEHAELIVNSVPFESADSATAFTPALANTAHTAEDTLCDPTKVPLPSYKRDPACIKSWGKPIKINAKDNPLGVQVFKMAAHDRHGAWFARRSVHQGIGFNKCKKAAAHEFLESLKVQEGPGSGAVRGVGADRRVESIKVSEESKLEVWQTSSAFPGPVTPRESLTLLVSSTNALSEESTIPQTGRPPRHFLVISRPTVHADAPDRSNLVKMVYESIEMIREIPLVDNQDPESNPFEWLMITRSDPGGGIPRFMVERGTPGSVVADVSKFLNWACSKSETDLEEVNEADIEAVIEEQSQKADIIEEKTTEKSRDAQQAPSLVQTIGQDAQQDKQQGDGLVAKFTDAVATTASDYLNYFQPPGALATGEDISDSSSEVSEMSDVTFQSAFDEQMRTPFQEHPPQNELSNDSKSSLDKLDSGETQRRKNSRELDKLLQKRTELDARAAKERDAFAQKAVQASEKDEKERNKFLDKQEKQRKKQEERYQHELAKIDARRIKEEKKEEQRRMKMEQKDQLQRLKSEVAEWKSRCHVAEKEAALLRQQVESLQRQNTTIVARLPDSEAKAILHQTAVGKGSRPGSSKAGSTKSSAS